MSPQSDQAGAALVLARDWAEMRHLSAWLDDRLDALGAPGESAHAVRLCLEEAVSNVIRHGDGESGIRVSLCRGASELVACIEDQGREFDPVLAAPLPAPTSMDTAANGGFGLRLIRRYADSLTYRREAGLNRLELRFKG